MNYEKTELKKWIEVEEIISFHYFEYVQNFFGIEEAHDFWEFVYVDSGEIQVAADSKNVLLHSGQGYLHSPGERHNVMTKEIFASVMIFSFTSMSLVLKELAGRILVFFEEEQRELAKILRYGQEFIHPPYDDFSQSRINWRDTMPFAAPQLIKNQIEIFFVLALQKKDSQDRGKKITGIVQETKEEENLMRILVILSEHLYDNISLEQLEAEAAYSASHMEKLFHKKLNTTVKDYYHRLKIEQAKKWISEGTFTFTEIAERLNYGTIHNFSRVFKKYTKLSPTAYQKTIRSRGTRI